MSLPSAQRHFTNCTGAGRVPEPVWTRAENLARTCIRNFEMKNDVILTVQVAGGILYLACDISNFDRPEIYDGRTPE